MSSESPAFGGPTSFTDNPCSWPRQLKTSLLTYSKKNRFKIKLHNSQPYRSAFHLRPCGRQMLYLLVFVLLYKSIRKVRCRSRMTQHHPKPEANTACLHLPPPPLAYSRKERKTQGREEQIERPSRAMQKFYVSQRRYIRDEIIAHELCPSLKAKHSNYQGDDLALLEAVLNCQ
jgi:hypothetical protein